MYMRNPPRPIASQKWGAHVPRGLQPQGVVLAYEAAFAACEKKGDAQQALRFFDVSFFACEYIPFDVDVDTSW